MIFFFTAIFLYMDDTDLLLSTEFPMDSDESFIQLIQHVVINWGLIVQVTGGALNKKKSYISINSFKFIRGKVVLE